jgi:hypothetical protein
MSAYARREKSALLSRLRNQIGQSAVSLPWSSRIGSRLMTG